MLLLIDVHLMKYGSDKIVSYAVTTIGKHHTSFGFVTLKRFRLRFVYLTAIELHRITWFSVLNGLFRIFTIQKPNIMCGDCW